MKKIIAGLSLFLALSTTSIAGPAPKPIIEGTELHTGDGNIGLYEKTPGKDVDKDFVESVGVAISGYSDNNPNHKIINFMAPLGTKSYPLVSYEGVMNENKTEMSVTHVYLNIPGSKSMVYNASKESKCKIIKDNDDNNYACIALTNGIQDKDSKIVFISKLHEKNNSI